MTKVLKNQATKLTQQRFS